MVHVCPPELQQQRYNDWSQTVWAIIQLSKPHMLRHGAHDQIFQAPSLFFGRGAWVRGYRSVFQSFILTGWVSVY